MMRERSIIALRCITLLQMMQEFLEQGSLEELTAFVAVGERGSFAGAALLVGRDASVISRRVSRLEKRLGVRLLARTTRQVSLTEAGMLYFRRVQAILEDLASASVEAAEKADNPQGKLRVSLPVTFGRQWIVPTFAPFLARYPQIRLDAHFTDRIIDVVADGFDVAIRVGVLVDSSLSAKRIAHYRNTLVAAPAYLKAHGRLSVPADLKNHACLGFSNHPHWPDWVLTKDGHTETIRSNCILSADNSEALLMAALEGAGIALLPDWLTGPAVRSGALSHVLSDWTGKGDGGVHAVMSPGRMIPAKVRLFVDAVAANIKSGWGK